MLVDMRLSLHDWIGRKLRQSYQINSHLELNSFLVLHRGKSNDLESFCDCRRDSKRGEQDALYPIRKDMRRAYRSAITKTQFSISDHRVRARMKPGRT